MSSEDMDDNHFDLIIVGTSLIEGIVACAAARNGKKVLHVDHHDYYGGPYAAFNLSGLIREVKIPALSQPTSNASNSSSIRAPVTELVIDGKDPSPNLNTFLSYNYSTKKFFHPSMQGIVSGSFTPTTISQCDSSHVHPAFFGLLSAESQKAANLLTKDREFCIDTATKTVPGTGAFIDSLIASGVSRYLEFKTNDAMFFLISDQHLGGSSMFGSSSSNKDSSSLLWRVPCSKNDIFNSKQLSALEKRTLMKFHQFVSDWGRTNAGADVTVLNENELAIGRSLYRPQNKAADAASSTANDISTESLQSQSFLSFLKTYHLSEKLQNLIMYGLCLLSTSSNTPVESTVPLSAQKGLQELSLHLNSLGKYGDNANLVPIYGLGEIVQGFCRMSAVWAGVYMLRYELSSLTVREVDEPEIEEKNDESSATTEEVGNFSGPTVDRTIREEKQEENVHMKRKKLVSIQGISEVERYEKVENQVALGPIYTAPRALVHFSYAPETCYCAPVFSLQIIFVYQGRLLPAERCLTVIPPMYDYKHPQTQELVHLNNPFAVHILQVDASASTVPEGASVLQLHTYLPSIAEKQEPFLFSEWFTEATKLREVAKALVQGIQSLLEMLSSKNENEGGFSEICHRAMLRPIHDRDSLRKQQADDEAILYCGDVGGYSLHLEDEVREAERLYKALFGADAIMFNPEGPDPQEEMQLRDDDDDEVEHLYKFATSALNLDNSPTSQEQSNEINVPSTEENSAVAEDSGDVANDLTDTNNKNESS